MTTPVPRSGESPFDAIRQVRPDGTEFWSARDLMASMDYDQWRNFEAAIDRAKLAAANQGYAAVDHFADASKVMEGGRWGSQTVADVELSRFAAYLTVMNGDPRKPEVAAAQSYFAIKTREAEAASIALDPTTPEGALVLARSAAAMAEQLIAARTQVKALEGPAAQAEVFRAAEGLCTIGDLANRFRAWAGDNHPHVKVRQSDVFDQAGAVGLIIRGNTVRHNQGTSQAIKAGWVKHHRVSFDTNTRGMQTTVSTRLTTRGEARLWDHLVSLATTAGSIALKDAS